MLLCAADRREAIATTLRAYGCEPLSDLATAAVAIVDDPARVEELARADPERPLILLSTVAPPPGVWEVVPVDDGDALVAALDRALRVRWLTIENRRLAQAIDGSPDDVLVGRSAAIAAVRGSIAAIAASGADVVLLGEPGTGKARAARMIHRIGAGRGAFVALACAAIPDALIDREIAAIADAAHGTLFLEDAAAASPMLRERLRTLPRPGVRIMAAVDSSSAAQALLGDRAAASLQLRIPPLRERRDDVPLLFAHLLDAAVARLRTPVPTLSIAVRQHLLEHDWPGNVRELADFADRVVLGLVELPTRADSAGSLPERVDAFERAAICAALEATGGDAGAAMAALGLPRKTFYYKVQRHAIDVAGFRTRARPKRAAIDPNATKPGHF